jgi:hypothetical protein
VEKGHNARVWLGRGGASMLLWSKLRVGKLKGRSAMLLGPSVWLGRRQSGLVMVAACKGGGGSSSC